MRATYSALPRLPKLQRGRGAYHIGKQYQICIVAAKAMATYRCDESHLTLYVVCLARCEPELGSGFYHTSARDHRRVRVRYSAVAAPNGETTAPAEEEMRKQRGATKKES